VSLRGEAQRKRHGSSRAVARRFVSGRTMIERHRSSLHSTATFPAPRIARPSHTAPCNPAQTRIASPPSGSGPRAVPSRKIVGRTTHYSLDEALAGPPTHRHPCKSVIHETERRRRTVDRPRRSRARPRRRSIIRHGESVPKSLAGKGSFTRGHTDCVFAAVQRWTLTLFKEAGDA
jgi:hypothetical protein